MVAPRFALLSRPFHVTSPYQDVMVLLLPLLVELVHVAVQLNHRREVQRVCGGDALLDDRDGAGGQFQYVSET